MPSYLEKTIRGIVDPELQEVENGRQELSGLMLTTIKEVAGLRKQQRSRLQKWLWDVPVAVTSPPAYYHEGLLEPDQKIAAFLDTNSYELSAGLFVGVVSGPQHTEVTKPELQVNADKIDGLKFAVNDRILRPCDQLELVTNSIATVELIRLETQLALQ